MSDRHDKHRWRLLTRGSWSEAKRFAEILREETVGGVLLLLAAGVAVGWANSPWSHAYAAMSAFALGPESLHLHLSISAWTADGLLAIFFFVVGLELKREFVAGDLRDPRQAALPILAAVGGMLVPASTFVGDQPGRRPPREPGRLGGPDRNRHRVRPRCAGGAVHPPAHRAAHVPADPGRGRRPARHHRHRRLLHRPPLAGATGAGADPRRTVRAGRAARVRPLVAAGAAGRRRVGAGARQRCARHRRRVCCWASRCRCWAGTRRPRASNTSCGRCQRASLCRFSRSSPPV